MQPNRGVCLQRLTQSVVSHQRLQVAEATQFNTSDPQV